MFQIHIYRIIPKKMYMQISVNDTVITIIYLSYILGILNVFRFWTDAYKLLNSLNKICNSVVYTDTTWLHICFLILCAAIVETNGFTKI